MAYKTITSTASIADCVSMGFSDLEELASEAREIVDNASEGLAQTQRIQTFDETASSLENITEPEIPETIDATTQLTYSEQTKRKGCSRAVRCSNAVSKLSAVVSWCEDRLNELADKEDDPAFVTCEDIETLRDDCQQAIDEAEGVEFPGMYG